jgi:hypothetical protein
MTTHPNPRPTRLVALALGLVLTFLFTGAAACRPTPVPNPVPRPTTTTVRPTTTTTAVPTSPDRHVFADSLGAQVVAAGLTQGDGHIWHALAGAPLSHWASQVITAAQTRPRSITLALGSNDAGTWTGGWDSADEAVWSWVIAAVPRTTDVIVILPHFTQPAEVTFPGVLAEVDQARSWLTGLPADRVDCTLDWRGAVDGQGLFLVDGIHAGDHRTVEARHALTTQAC